MESQETFNWKQRGSEKQDPNPFSIVTFLHAWSLISDELDKREYLGYLLESSTDAKCLQWMQQRANIIPAAGHSQITSNHTLFSIYTNAILSNTSLKSYIKSYMLRMSSNKRQLTESNICWTLFFLYIQCMYSIIHKNEYSTERLLYEFKWAYTKNSLICEMSEFLQSYG